MPREPVPLTWLFNFVKPYGVKVSSTSGGNHVPSSWHYVHRAIDVTGPPPEMMKVAKAALARPKSFKEVFYDPAGKFVKNGVVHPGGIGGHRDHVHLAR
jgi:hypothetical protein